ncbi:MAG: CinA family nicotinamide mononucleotide deamidase-related protein [Deferribacteraceae bacterium]|jgi:nicotinamide-nucleotide amidase|nr:CinA family nicotinamide mononucleotide deamidase-related protein [Deferribacteraceae bacterium]
MIQCAIFAIGEELLEGSVTDTNSSYIAKRLTSEGLFPRRVALLPDEKECISSSVETAMRNYPLVITAGGLGPTFDDLTTEAIAQACGVKTALYEEAEKHITERLTRLNVKINKNHLRQAFLPEGSVLFPNPHGTAYGFGAEAYNSIVISLPGVPYEMYAIFNESVIPFLKNRFTLKAPFKVDLRFGDIPESDVDSVIRNMSIPEGIRCIINVSMGEVVVKIRDDGLSGGERFAEKVKKALEYHYLGKDDESPAVIAVKLLKEHGFTLSVAESCTGGLLGGVITSVPGVSELFTGGIISYKNKVKTEQLRISEDTVRRYGAVSEECAVAMAKGVKILLHTDCSIAVTGIAGPDGGTPDKPTGTVYIAVITGESVVCKRFLFSGDRSSVRDRTVKSALVMFAKTLKNL